MADGFPSTSGPVTKTCPLSFTISDSHHETLNCHVTSLQTHAVIIGIDWLHTHNPHIHWRKHLVSFRDEHCIKRCLSHYVPVLSLASLDLDFDSNDLESSDLSVDDLYSLQLASLFCRELSVIHEHSDPSLSLNSAEEKPVATLPPEYADFADLFKNRPLGTLPPHRPFDHTITLEPDAAAPFGPLYNLSEKELEALREFLDDVVLWIHIPDLRIEIDGVIFSYYLFLFSVSYKEGSKVLFAPSCLFPLRFFPVPLLITRTLTFCPYPHTQLPLALQQYSTPSAFGRRCNYTIPGL